MWCLRTHWATAQRCIRATAISTTSSDFSSCIVTTCRHSLRRFSSVNSPSLLLPKETKAKRIWPRQLPEEIDHITPPSSTSVASTSKALLLEGLFYGELNLELLEFPQLDSIEEVKRVDELHEQLKHFVLQLNSAEMAETGTIPADLRRQMASMGLFGLDVEQFHGGLGLTVTQLCRAFEALGLDGSLFASLDAHLFSAVQLIAKAGTEEQKARLLPPLASGSKVGALCHSEVSSGSDPYAITTKAVSADGGQTYQLTGQKTWVTNGAIADQFVVVARLVGPGSQLGTGKYAALIVDRSAPGIHVGPRLETFGLRASNIVDINFDNVTVAASDLLGDCDDIVKVIAQTRHRQQLCFAASTVGLLRYLLSYATENCLQRHQFGRPIGEFDLVRVKLAELTYRLYAIETGVFYLAGLWDAQPGRDLSLEVSALKIFSSETLWHGLNDCVQIMGRTGLTNSLPLERCLRDARCLLNHGGTNEVLRVVLASSCLQRRGPQLQAKAEVFRSIPRSPIGAVRGYLEMWLRRTGRLAHRVGAGPKVTEGGASRNLCDHVHPNFAALATRLAVLTQRFHTFVEMMVMMNHSSIMEEQMVLGRLADCTTDLLLTAICMGRASRAISIGVHLHDYEITLAQTFAKLALNRVERIIRLPLELDRNRRRIASVLLEHQGYPVAHPLTRVW